MQSMYILTAGEVKYNPCIFLLLEYSAIHVYSYCWSIVESMYILTAGVV